MYNLNTTEQFVHRIENNSNRAIDSIIIHFNKLVNYRVQQFYDDLSHHDTQIIINDNKLYQCNCNYKLWKFDKGSIPEFTTTLTYEACGHIYINYNVDAILHFYI